MNSKTNLRGFADMIWGRRYLVAGITLSALTAAILFSFFLPRRYEASARVRLAANAAAGERAPDATEIREKLLAIAGGAGETAIEIESPSGAAVLDIRHMGEDPDQAVATVKKLAAGYEDAVQMETMRAAKGELDGVRSRLEEAGRESEEVTATLAAFEKEHAEQRFGEASDTPARLQEAKTAFAAADDQVTQLERKLVDIREALKAEPEFVEVEKTTRNEEKIASLEKEIRAAEATLSVLRRSRSADDPEVARLVDSIAKMNGELAKEKEGERTVSAREPNPVRADLRESERAAESELLVKRRFAEEFGARVAALEKQVADYPTLRRRWQELVANRNALGKEIAELTARRADLEKTYGASAAASAVRFDVLEPPVRPSSPTSPNRTLIALLGLVVGSVVGVGIAAAKKAMDRSFGSPEEVAAAFEIPMLGAISKIETLGEREAAKRKRRVAAVAVAALLLLAVATAFLQVQYDGPISSFLRGTVQSGK